MSAFLALLLWSNVVAAGPISGGLPGPINGDFDHDGKIDTARIVRETGDVYFLQIARGAAPGKPVRVSLGQHPPDFMVPAKNGGVVTTACGKGLGAKSDPCPRPSVKVTRGDLMLGATESSQSVLIWDGQTFHEEWLSD